MSRKNLFPKEEIFRLSKAAPPLPLPLGEVAERSEDGEGIQNQLQCPLSHLR